jgi:hypothetical protein
VGSPIAVAGVALLGYLLIFLLFFNSTGDLRNFILIGEEFVTKSDRSSVIALDPTYRYSEYGGYDGQFVYFIALDPGNARYYVDNPSYRYTRILYPMAARALALGNPDWVPSTLLLVNWLALGLGTWAVAAWCAARGLSPWLGLVYAFFVGQAHSFTRDLHEPLAYGLLAVAVYFFDGGRRMWAGLVFGLAALGREQTLVFPALYALRILLEGDLRSEWRGRTGRFALFSVLAFGPFALWQLTILSWFGSLGFGVGSGFLRLPLSGVYDIYPLPGQKIEVVEAVVLPGTICLVVALLAIWRNREARGRVEIWALAINSLVFATLLFPDILVELFAAARVATPIVLAAIYSLPFVRRRGWFYVCAALWLAPTLGYILNPLLEFLHGE